MLTHVAFKNYRCFADDHEVLIRVSPGLTAIVGINNSGKSALLRFFWELRQILHTLPFEAAHSVSKASAVRFNVTMAPDAVPDKEAVFTRHNSRPLTIRLMVEDKGDQSREYPPGQYTIHAAIERPNNCQTRIETHGFAGRPFARYRDNIFFDERSIEVASIDALRNASNLLNGSMYLPAFRNAVNTGSGPYFDMQVGTAFVDQWHRWQTGHSSRTNEATVQLVEDLRRLLGFRKLQVFADETKRTLKVVINDRSYTLDEVGSGVAQFILVLGNVAVRRPSMLLLDEPELNLHPSLQIDFLNTLASYTTSGIVLFATHSYGLAQAVADRIYSVSRDANTDASRVQDYRSTPRLSEFLGAMGYSGYHQLGFDRVVLVEGPTEVRVLLEFLRLYDKNHQVVPLSLGGSSMINGHCADQLAEVKRITPNVSALIDSEKASADAPLASNRQEFLKICRDLAIDCHVLERRATENYLTDVAVRSVKGEKYGALTYFEKLGSDTTRPIWSKNENWRIAREMSKADIDQTDLGGFLKKL